MRASIVVPSRGGAGRLPTLFAALEQQRGLMGDAGAAPDFDVIVVLDGDIDDSASVVDAYTSRLPVSAIVFDENRGRARALSAGFDAATGEVLIRCDDDLVPNPEFVARHIDFHQKNVGFGVIGMCPDVFPDSTYATVYGRQADEKIRAGAFALAPSDTWRLWSANVSVTRETYDKVGPYDDAFRRYGWEDIDWGYRLHRLGHPIVILAGVEADHLKPALTAQERIERAYESGRSKAKFAAKHGVAAPSAQRRPRSLWDLLVIATAAGLNDRRVRAAGKLIDQAIEVVPRPVATKLVALGVESGARAGERDFAV